MAPKKKSQTTSSDDPKTPSKRVKKTPEEAQKSVKKRVPSTSEKTPRTPKTSTIPKTPKTKAPKVKQQETLFKETLFKEPTEFPVTLQPSAKQTPAYSMDQQTSEKKKSVQFENIVAHSAIVEALKHSNDMQPNEILQRILPAALRGSDILAFKPTDPDGFLIGVITASSRILSEQIAKGTPQHPAVLFLSPNQKSLEQTVQTTQKIFKQIDVTFGSLSENLSSEETKALLDMPIDILFATPKTLAATRHSHDLKLNSVGMCFVHGVDKMEDDCAVELGHILNALPLERVQKLFVSNSNSGKVRELAFKHLEDPECFSLLPSYVKERSPKQFAHALPSTQKFQVLLGHLKTHKPQCAVVFANTRTVAEWIAFKLHGNGIKVDLITSVPSAHKRRAIVSAVKARETNVIVTTDFHCKDFGLEDLNCIYHFDLPDSGSKFLDRLNRIEGSKNPISVLFICEDYGFNMNKIEETLGFKIHIVEPDKNYFNLKDISEYPLEPSGRVKRIGHVYETPKKDAREQVVAAPAEITAPKTIPHEHVSPAVVHEPVSAAAAIAKQQPRLQPRSAVPGAQPPQGKFVHRDFKARDAIEAAKQASRAAFEKRKEPQAQTQVQTKQPAPKEVGLFSFAVTLAGDAVKAAVNAARDSISKNMEEKRPSFFGLFKKKK